MMVNAEVTTILETLDVHGEAGHIIKNIMIT
jgi:hypothetical protein